MVDATPAEGAVLSLWRYPVKSMLGEELASVEVREHGLVGDRAFALQDRSDAKIASAKNPRKWPTLFAFRAALEAGAGRDPSAQSLRITLPGGRIISGADRDIDRVLSQALGREVTLARASGPAAAAGRAEHCWADIEGLERRNDVTEFDLPPGTFFDGATVHVLTTATLEELGRHHPQGRFDPRRFRPNIVVQTGTGASGFVESGWIGRTIAVGEQVRLEITRPTGRCVMTTLPQADLPRDIDILRTVVQRNDATVGVYATVVRGGMIRRGDRVRVSAPGLEVRTTERPIEERIT